MESQDDKVPISIGVGDADTEMLIRTLQQRDYPIGELVRYGELERISGRVLDQMRGILRTAKRRLAQQRHFYQVVTGQGWLRVDDVQKAKEATAQRKKNARAARRTRVAMSAVIAENLPEPERARFLMELSALNLAEAMGKEKVVQSFQAVVEAQQRRLSLRESAEALRTIFRAPEGRD